VPPAQTATPTPTTTSEQITPETMDTPQPATQVSTCAFDITFPESVSVISSTVTESEASYQLINPQVNVLLEVETQLQPQGWTKLETTTNKAKNSSETLFSCAQGGKLHVTFGPTGRSLIYVLRLTLA
jgi:hypothetical protein